MILMHYMLRIKKEKALWDIIFKQLWFIQQKMFCAILISNQATDHGLLPEIFTKMVENIGIIPEVSSADSAYNDYETLAFLEDNDIKSLIDNTRAAKLRNGNGSKKIFHKRQYGF